MILFFRYFFIIYCCVYTYLKILNIKQSKSFYYITNPLFSIFFALLSSIFARQNMFSNTIILFIFFFLFISIYTRTKLDISFTTAILSFSISCISITIAGLLISSIATIIYDLTNIFSINLCVLLSGPIQYLLIVSLFKFKRLQRGMPFLFHSQFVNGGILLSTIVIFLFFYLTNFNHASLFIHFLILLFILFLAFLLLFWWRRRITLDYVQKLRMDEVESLYKRISDNEQEIEKLNTNNDYLSKVIHKDNKLIPAMEMALHSYLLEAPTMEAEEAKQFGADLLSQLQSMSAEREGIISNYQKNTDFHPKIGIYSVDAVILYMEKRAEKFNITYNLRFDNNIKDVIVGFIHERDMLHLLSDLIENAIIAVKDASHREIFLHIGFLQGCLFIDLYDSGIPFEPAVYQDFGNCQHTTHADSGGSGIGLMDIWNLKRKYKASLQIYEYLPDSDIYTKKIRLLFDRRNHFLLQTYRDKEIRSFITRSDLHVFPLKEMKKKDKE